MLAVGVCCNQAIEPWKLAEKVVDPSLQGAAFAEVQSMFQNMHAWKQDHAIEYCRSIRAATVIDDNNGGKPLIYKLCDELGETIFRLPNGNEGRKMADRLLRNIAGIVHVKSAYIVKENTQKTASTMLKDRLASVSADYVFTNREGKP
jgi:hypothetical protein